MLQPSDSQKSQFPSNLTLKTAGVSVEQSTIGGSVVIKGEISGCESLFIEGRIEGTVDFTDHRVTIGRDGIVAANITAREVVILGKVQSNIQCSDRLEIRSEGALTGDVVTQRISVEDRAVLKGSVQVRAAQHQNDKSHRQTQAQPKAIAAVRSLICKKIRSRGTEARTNPCRRDLAILAASKLC